MENEEMMEKWMKMKAMESCWGKENMKLYTVSMKRAIAKCHQEDAPELSLPPFRSSYRFVNTMMNQGNDEFSYVQPYSTNSGRSDNFMNQDIKSKVESNFGPMEQIMQQTQLTEYEFFPLVMHMLHGEEMEYMTEGF